MPVVVITPPTAPLVSLDEAKEHLRVDHGDDDGRIQALLWAAQTEFAAPDGWSGRSFSIQQLELQLPHFAGWPGHLGCGYAPADILLPAPPLFVDGTHPLTVKYTDRDGAEQTVDAATIYSVVSNGAAGAAHLALNYGMRWPLARWQENAVRIRFWSGYADDDVRAEPIKAAMKLHVGMLYDGEDEAKARAAIVNLLSPFRIYRLSKTKELIHVRPVRLYGEEYFELAHRRCCAASASFRVRRALYGCRRG